MGNSPRTTRARATAAKADAPTGGEKPVEGDLPPAGRRRGADPNRVISHYVRMGAEKDQQLAAAYAVIDELEELVESLQDQLVTATSGNAEAPATT